jgi:5-methylcytosine-specific restriction enzyme B
MLKEKKSWSKPANMHNLIAVKKVDWSVFTNGSHIPLEFHEDFKEANNGIHIQKGKKHEVILYIHGRKYSAQLVNVDRKGVAVDSLQLRYDYNRELKSLLLEKFKTSYNYIRKVKEGNEQEKKVIHVPDGLKESMEFYKTDTPFEYKVVLKTKEDSTIFGEEKLKEGHLMKKDASYWWVNQGQSAKAETEGGFLWSPKQAKNGTALSHHNDLTKPKPGEIVFAYSSVAIRSICIVEDYCIDAAKPSSLASHNWEVAGNYLKVKYFPLEIPIGKNEIPEEWRLNENGPFDKNGNVKQGYFYETSSSFAEKLLSKFEDKIPQGVLEDVTLPEEEVEEGSDIVELKDDKKLVDHVHHYINTKGFHYTKDQLNNFYLSLKTKPFVILSGISGTGKTKIVQLFAESIGATEDNGQFRLIPVRPDWSDGSDLIGFEDIKGDFQAGPLTEVLIEANKPENREKPYFVLLDEMNLARVEYYFSDLLSVMESREVRDGEFISSPVVDREEVGQLLLRENLYIIGTVNMDETTHPFSSKVLDRANTIEFNDVSLAHFGFLSEEPLANAVTIRNDQVAGRYLTLKEAFFENETLIREVTDWLVEINRILERTKSHFAYRVRDEVCFYMIYNEQSNLMTRETAFDYQFHQKILPRLTGNDIKTENVLKDLFRFCTNHEYDEQQVTLPLEEARFPMSAEKLSEMIRKIQYDGFTSFWG